MEFVKTTKQYLINNYKEKLELGLDTAYAPYHIVEYKLFVVGDKHVGYMSYDHTGSIWNVEVFPEYRGNSFGKQMLMKHIDESNNDKFVLSPITEELVTYYEKIGFKQTEKYESHFAEFPIMEFIV